MIEPASIGATEPEPGPLVFTIVPHGQISEAYLRARAGERRTVEHRSIGESQGSPSPRSRSARSPALPEPVGGRPANGRAMPEARYLEIVPTQVAQAHYALPEVLIREHEAEPKDVRGRVAHKQDPPFPG